MILCGLYLMGSPVPEGVSVLTAEESYPRGVQGVFNRSHLTSASESSEENQELQVETLCISAEQPVFKS